MASNTLRTCLMACATSAKWLPSCGRVPQLKAQMIETIRHQRTFSVSYAVRNKQAEDTMLSEPQAHRKSFIDRVESVLGVFGYKGRTRNYKSLLGCSGARLFVACAEYSNYENFVTQFKLEDTFFTWCKVLQLHMWMLLLRLRNHSNLQLKNDFAYVRYKANQCMWMDIEKRAKKIASGSVKKESVVMIGENYKALVIGYDEGYLTDDKTLAGAVWRHLLARDTNVEPEVLWKLVRYIHKNLRHLEMQSDDNLLHGYVSFLSLDSDKPDKAKDAEVLKKIKSVS